MARSLLVVEDIAETRAWLADTVRDVFGAEPFTAGSIAEARKWLRGGGPGLAPLLALVDLGLPDGNGASLIEEIVRIAPGAMVVVTTIYEDDASLLQALAAGASGYILKDQDGAALGQRLALIDAGEVPISPAIARKLLKSFHADQPSQVALTPRENEVLRLIGRGLRSGEAADVLGIGQQTVASHIKAVYRKLDISSRAEAAIEARRRGLT
jgi:DNA-binding NarL/FixJ family response regulator